MAKANALAGLLTGRNARDPSQRGFLSKAWLATKVLGGTALVADLGLNGGEVTASTIDALAIVIGDTDGLKDIFNTIASATGLDGLTGSFNLSSNHGTYAGDVVRFVGQQMTGGVSMLGSALKGLGDLGVAIVRSGPG